MPELCCAVAYAQTLRIEELVDVRKEVGSIFNDATKEYNNLIEQQYVGKDCINSYWTWVVAIKDADLWDDFRKEFISNGGDRFYGAWKLGYLEPFFLKKAFLGREEYVQLLKIYKKD